MNSALEQQIHRAADIWKQASHAVAMTGAGISVPSGIPDFRSPGGLWSSFDPWKVASLQALAVNPKGVWEFLLAANAMFGKAAPNPAHTALADLEADGRLQAIITQNIDSLHQAAGSGTVIEFHGHCRSYHCRSCGLEHDPAVADTLTAETIPWLCECGGVVRPDVVFFGEGIPPRAMEESREQTRAADLAVIVGTSGEVAPANSLPYAVKHAGGRVIEINLGPTSFGGLADVRLDAPAEEVLPLMADEILDRP